MDIKKITIQDIYKFHRAPFQTIGDGIQWWPGKEPDPPTHVQITGKVLLEYGDTVGFTITASIEDLTLEHDRLYTVYHLIEKEVQNQLDKRSEMYDLESKLNNL